MSVMYNENDPLVQKSSTSITNEQTFNHSNRMSDKICCKTTTCRIIFSITMIIFVALICINVFHYLRTPFQPPTNTSLYWDTQVLHSFGKLLNSSETIFTNSDIFSVSCDTHNHDDDEKAYNNNVNTTTCTWINKTNCTVSQKQSKKYSKTLPKHEHHAHEVTLISGYIFENNAGYNYGVHTFTKWLKWTQNMYSFNYPMIIFADVNNNISHFVNIRKKNVDANIPSIIIPIQKSDLLFYNEIFSVERRYRAFMDKPLACTIWSNKLAFLRFAAIINPFQSKYFMWVDAGLVRYTGTNILLQVTRKYNLLMNRVSYVFENDKLGITDEDGRLPDACTKIFNRWSRARGESMTGKGFVAAGHFGGTAKAIKQFGDAYFDLFYDGIVKQKSVCYEQGLYANVICRHPELVNLLTCSKGSMYQLWAFVNGIDTCVGFNHTEVHAGNVSV